ncbi:MAG: glycogen synthase GlgA [Candidatus Omnitrophota bacterium]
MKILLASSEVVPFSKTGGLADVAGTLPYALKDAGDCDVRVIAPFYKMTKDKKINMKKVADVDEPALFGGLERFSLLEYESKGVKFYFTEHDGYFNRDALYGAPGGDYEDNAKRFSFFSKSILAASVHLGFHPDIIHLNDWQTALVPLYKNVYFDEAHPLTKAKVLFTVHNLAYQGLFGPEVLQEIGVPEEFFTMYALEFYGKLNFMKSGILYSDAISTVSKRYAREILTPEYGCGLEGLLTTRKEDLYGILNGADYENWNPEHDTLIPVNYGPKSMEKKADCKKELMKQMKLSLSVKSPLLGYVGRLAEQKGIDLMAGIVSDVLRQGAGFALLGTGDAKYERIFADLAKKYPGKLGIRIGFDNKLAHLIEAGLDIFLMPSRYEPCGLNQMYSLKYGTVPIVRSTGGLDDTIIDYSSDTENGNGFKFDNADLCDFLETVKKALKLFKNEKKWRELQLRGMNADFSWKRSAREYLALYKKMIGAK